MWVVLLTGPYLDSRDGLVMVFHGGIRGRDAQQDQWWRDLNGLNKPGWCVPQSALRMRTSAGTEPAGKGTR